MEPVRIIVQRKPHGRTLNPESDETWLNDPDLLERLAAAGLHQADVDDMMGVVWGQADTVDAIAAIPGVIAVERPARQEPEPLQRRRRSILARLRRRLP